MADDNNAPQEGTDSQISREVGLEYWEGVEASVSGMLGGLPYVSRVDLRGSRNFLAKLGIGQKPGLRVATSALEGGAGLVLKSWDDMM
jgi:protein N-terminal methyltransferase